MARKAGCSSIAAFATPIGAKDRYGATSTDGNGSLRPTPVASTATQTAGNAYCRPRSTAGQTDDFIPHSSFHWPRKRPPHAVPHGPRRYDYAVRLSGRRPTGPPALPLLLARNASEGSRCP